MSQYPPQQGDYPPQQGQYPPQQGQYPPQGPPPGAYQQPHYPPEQQYPPQGYAGPPPGAYGAPPPSQPYQQPYPGQPTAQQQPLMQHMAPPPVEGAAGLKFAQDAPPEQLLTVMDYVNEVKVKQKAFLLEAVTGGSCIPATYAVKDVNGVNLLYGVEYSHPCSRCCCGMNRKMRLDMIPAAAVEDPSGDAKFSFAEMKNQIVGCWKFGGAEGKPVAFTIERSMEGSLFPCCRYSGACLNCCLERVEVKLGPAMMGPDGKPLPRDQDTRPVIASVTQPFLGGGCTPTYHLREGPVDGKIYATEKGAGGLCESCCPGFCMCACTDNTFNLYENEGVGDKIEPNGHITRVNPKDMAGWCRQAFTDADSFDVKFPPVAKEKKAGMLAAMLLTDLQFFDDGGDLGCECSDLDHCKTHIKLAIINFYGCSCPLTCTIDWGQIIKNSQNSGGS